MLRLYEIIRWGYDKSPDGADGEDTVFLVRSSDFRNAVSLVEEVLRQLPHETVRPYANEVLEIGQDQGAETKPRILIGPCIQFGHNFGYSRCWIRRRPRAVWEPQDGTAL